MLSNGGRIAVVGIGPGSVDDMSHRAYEAIRNADVVVGFDVYLEMIRELISGKTVVGTGATQEIDRCLVAVEQAFNGKTVAVISSGDAGIHGMAGLALELVMRYPPLVRPEVVIIPGISAICSAAAELGAPLMHDFAVINMSDLLTPWEVIEKRVEAAAAGDFVLALYNPKSGRFGGQIEKVKKIMLTYRPGSTPVGIVHHASRGDEVELSELSKLHDDQIDALSLVIIGNLQTYVKEGRMITPR